MTFDCDMTSNDPTKLYQTTEITINIVEQQKQKSHLTQYEFTGLRAFLVGLRSTLSQQKTVGADHRRWAKTLGNFSVGDYLRPERNCDDFKTIWNSREPIAGAWFLSCFDLSIFCLHFAGSLLRAQENRRLTLGRL